ncbi:MAG: hypothetical protein LBJ31_06940 [Treponema sp.]|nr:hypothetical protein [Treponema sp.]
MDLFFELSGLSLSAKLNAVWRLLNETSVFLQRCAALRKYEPQIFILRGQLQKSPGNITIIHEVFRGLLELRKKLRLSGYDLSVAKYRLVFDGFRNDDCLAGGFYRLVIGIAKDAFYWKTGDENHITLAAFLEQSLAGKRSVEIRETHYLWYKRTKTSLVLSGAVTEKPEDFERLKTAGEADELFFLSRLKGLY